jgi:signal transduction histidine kinase
VYRALARAPSIDFDLFLKDSLQLLVEVLSAKYAMVGRLDKDKGKVTSVALYMNNQIVDNISYDIEGTPCKEVIRLGPKMIVDNVSELFPEDEMLSDLNIKCYFGSPLINSQGDAIGLVVVMDDKPHTEIDWYEDTLSVVTTRIAMEMERADALRALDEHRKNLQAEVEIRTADLQQANKELESFAYSVSHDLRTPLRAINGFTHILVEDKADLLDDEGRQLLNKICTSSEKMGTLIDSILSLSRISRQELDIHKVNISSLSHAIIDDLSDSYDLERVAIDIQENIEVEGDNTLLRIVLDNLIRNALKFSAGKDKPELIIGKQQGNNGQPVIFVQDNGVGFDMSFADRLFKPFQRLHDEAEYRGYGVGLAIVHRIIERHGGKIWARSEPDAGTTIYFELGKKV